MNLMRAMAMAAVLSSMAAASAGDLQIQADPKANPWTHLNFNNGGDVIRFAIIADRTGGLRPQVWETAIRRLNLLQPEFVINVGDTIPGYTDDAVAAEQQRDEFDSLVKSLQMPFFYVSGNHDLTNPMLLKSWQKRYGRTYYHFVYKNALFLVLSTEDEIGGSHCAVIGDEQFEYAKKTLAENADVRWTFVFMHRPAWTYDKGRTGHWDEIEALLAGRPHTVFVGHAHDYKLYQRHGRDYIVLATTGGGSSLRGVVYGEFDHLMLVTLTRQGPAIVNLMLDGIVEKDVRTEAMAEYVETVTRNFSVNLLPVGKVAGGSFSSGSTQLRLANQTDRALKFTGTFRGSNIATTPRNIQATVPAGGEQIVPVKLSSGLPLTVAEAEPVLLDWTVAPVEKDAAAVAIDGVSAIGLEQEFACRKAAKRVVVDGDLSEWGNLPLTMIKPMQILNMAVTWDGEADASLRFATAYDDKYLYVAVQVTDDKMQVDPRKAPWEQDGLEICVDGRAQPQSSYSDSRVLGIGLCPGATAEQTVFVDRKNKPEGTQAVCVKTDTGYVAEVAIPLSYLNEKQDGQWKQFRLNIALNDSDAAGEQVQLWWRPDWRTDENFAGSGEFQKK